MNSEKIKNATPYPDINEVLRDLAEGVVDILTSKLVGIYLFGSLSYGDFHPDSSDIDVVVILKHSVSQDEMKLLKQLHQRIETEHKKWAKRIECSYTPVEMLDNILPPTEPRPYVGEGVFYPEAQYGNEWIINLYLMYEYGIVLVGPSFRDLISPIPVVEVQKACIRDLFQEWEPKIRDAAWLSNSHYQSYIVLNLCRILYTVACQTTGSKTSAAAWVKHEFGEWRDLIQTAESWEYGAEMKRQEEVIEFIRFVIREVQKSPLYGQHERV
jgi:predicted nucleotidyltransferase